MPQELLWILALTACASAAEPLDLSSEVEALRIKYKLPACASAVMEKGRIVAIGASGVRRQGENPRVTIDDLWLLGSCTKSMTAALTALLVDAGKLRWETTIFEAFPDIPCNATWRKVTIWDLVTHRSGIGQIWLPDTSALPIPPRQMRESFARSVLSRPPAEPPGKFAYSNAGYAILAAALERASGASFEEMLANQLFTPLGLRTAGFGSPSSAGKTDQPFGHWRRGDSLRPVEPMPANEFPPLLMPSAGVHLSLTDFAHYSYWMATNEPRLLKPETFAQLQTPPAGSTYSGGLWKSEFPGIGGAAVRHTGTAAGYFAVFYAGHDLAAVTVFNTEGIGWEWIGDTVLAVVLEAVQKSE